MIRNDIQYASLCANLPDAPSVAVLPPCTPRLDAGVSLRVARAYGASRLASLAEHGGYRARVGGGTDPCSIQLINPAGGLAGGDRVTIELAVDDGARMVASTPAAERIYGSERDVTHITCQVRVGADAMLDWLPQQTIFYDGARYRRRLEVELADTATILLLELYTLGRRATGERLTDVLIRDDWRVRRAGRLVFAEALRFEGAASDALARAALGGGAGAAATLVYVARDAEERVTMVRELLAADVHGAATVVEGVLVVRWLAEDPAGLTAALQSFLAAFRDQPMPRGW